VGINTQAGLETWRGGVSSFTEDSSFCYLANVLSIKVVEIQGILAGNEWWFAHRVKKNPQKLTPGFLPGAGVYAGR